MIRRVQQYIRRHALLADGEQVLVCVSGGADSIALLDVLMRLGYRCHVAHCNFHLRGDESMRDEHFVRAHCEAAGIPVDVHDFDVFLYAREHQQSIEQAARELRYRWFGQLAAEKGCSAIAVAHHQNDQAETLLLHLRRGCGIRGLGGMRPKAANPMEPDGIPIIRPLLCTTRDYIEYYLRSKRHIAWITDSTNQDTRIPRNAIRAQLAACTKAEIEAMAATAERMQGYIDWLDHKDTDAAGKARLYEELRMYQFPEPDKIYDALQRGEGGKQFESATHRATIRHHKLQITKK